MGLFFSDGKKIYRDEFKKILRSVPELSESERAYTEGAFQRALEDGLTKGELEKEISRLKRVSGDPLDSSELEKLKKKLVEHL
ncbi:hypothetical protein KKF19_03350 [Patescibacteria group bacterium]|nr:hypothetical protein [Patescibacteria group bacterium]